ncbi:MAG: hypothetical protein IJ242_03885, partial [Clostridia bacterium]|nr:hypothetical protein [Clostridia bacterium]
RLTGEIKELKAEADRMTAATQRSPLKKSAPGNPGVLPDAWIISAGIFPSSKKPLRSVRMNWKRSLVKVIFAAWKATTGRSSS